MVDINYTGSCNDLLDEAMLSHLDGNLLDLDFDADSIDLLNVDSMTMDAPVDAHYGAVAALATQGAVFRPVPSPTLPGSDQQLQNWHRWYLTDPPITSGEERPSAGAVNSYENSQQPPHFGYAYPATSNVSPAMDFFDKMPELPSLGPVNLSDPASSSRGASLGTHDSSSSRTSIDPAQKTTGTWESSKLRKSDAELRADRTKEKNKRAQKKFRQKQKDKHEELEKSAAELASRLKETLTKLDSLQLQKVELEEALTQTLLAAKPPAAMKNPEEEEVFVPAKGFECFSSRSGILLEVVFDPPRRLTRDQAIRLSVKDHVRIWAEVCRQASELLKADNEDVNAPSGRRLRALLNERHGLLSWTSVNNPLIMHKLMTSKLVDPPIPDTDPPSPQFWRELLEGIKLTPTQIENFMTARKTYLIAVGRLLEERRRLQQVLKDLDTGFGGLVAERGRSHVLWVEAAHALQENVDAFHVNHCVFMVTLFTRAKGFSLFQEAQLLVRSFPHVPDVFAFLKELASIQGEVPTAELLKQGAAQSSHTLLPGKVCSADAEPSIALHHKLESAITSSKLETFVEKLSQ